MAAYFFESSALVKRYINEPGTTWVRSCAALTSAHWIYVFRITAVEVASAVCRSHRNGRISTSDLATILIQIRQDFADEYLIREVMPSILDRAMSLAEIYSLRAYDAVQLAGLEEIQFERDADGLPPIRFASSDLDLNAAATAMGIAVEDPNQYP